MSLLSFLKKASEHGDEKPLFTLYGDPDVGKTSLAAQFPSPVFARVGDVSVTELQRNGLVSEDIPSTDIFDSYEKFDLFLTAILEAPDDQRPKTLVVDGLGGVQELIFRHVTATDFKGSRISFASYGKGIERSVPIFEDFISKANAIRKKGVVVIFLAHAHTVESCNAIGENYLRIVPRLHKSILPVLDQQCPSIGYIAPTIVTVEAGLKTKAVCGEGRPACNIHFVGRTNLLAKNKLGIDAPVSMGSSPQDAYANLCNAIHQAKLKNTNKESA